MNIKSAALFSEMQAMARQARQLDQSVALPAEHPAVTNSSQADFADLFKTALNNVNGLQKRSSELATAVEMGDPRVSLAQAMIAGQKSSIAFEATVQVRNKLVEAYKEIMQMPV
jgi:flagellar hook-basal body complex protein FliE